MKIVRISLLTVLFLFVISLPVRVHGAGRDGFRLDEKGTVTVVLSHGAQDGISSLGFSLSVESTGGAVAEFQFAEDTAEILEYRYDGDSRRINVYVAGTEALFGEGTDSLTVGRIVVKDESGRETAAGVSVVADSLQYVYGTELRTVTDLDLPGVVQIGSASGSTPAVTPVPTATPAPTVTPAPGTTPVPVATSTPGAAQTPEEPEGDSEDPAPAKTPAAAPVQTPVRTPGTVSRPQSTKVPVSAQNPGGSLSGSGSASQTPGSEPDSSGSSLPPGTPEEEEDGFIFSRSPDGEDIEQATGSKGINVVLVIAVIVIVIVIVVEIVAFVVIKKKPEK